MIDILFVFIIIIPSFHLVFTKFITNFEIILCYGLIIAVLSWNVVGKSCEICRFMCVMSFAVIYQFCIRKWTELFDASEKVRHLLSRVSSQGAILDLTIQLISRRLSWDISFSQFSKQSGRIEMSNLSVSWYWIKLHFRIWKLIENNINIENLR